MAVFLTQEWLDVYRTLGAELPERQGATARIQYVVTSTPHGDDVAYHVVFVDGRIDAAALGTLDEPDAVLTLVHTDAVGVQRGDLDPNVLFSAGTIAFDGDMRSLMSLLPILWPSPRRRLGSARRYLALQEELRARTEYPDHP
ncbi:SCP2 sterol-binding domain-containing protein [Pseudonocardia sp.]|uniref:SCP2 sterol-binding domain-containing protein n=1 Tax=Pseudonocardia sp. TaxID=60912 RepID=UPI003D150F58